jgi:hypothetical protein
MQTKLIVTLFVTAIIASSFTASVLPMANALTARTDFSDRHLSASYGNSPICGDHVCGPGEKTAWADKISSLQREGTGKIGKGETYKDVLQHIQFTSGMPSMHQTMKMTEKMNMGANMTNVGNMTKGTK